MWETVIGLEVHIQLATQSKIFSSSPTLFGAAPNAQANEVDLGLPGVLPVLNKEVVKMACQFGLAVDAEINQRSIFARKNYFYPDLPKGYQISQYEEPIVKAGHLNIQLENGQEKLIRITRAHLEEDAGKSVHDCIPNHSGIDLNRAGMPLLEIVSEPDIRSAEEAVAYLKSLHEIITFIGISDGNMAEGSMRCDVNISMRPQGQTELGTRAEIKNVNSFRFVQLAIEYEMDRQVELLESGQKVVQETRLFDSEKQTTRSMRGKEEANDYRYFPDPDLLPVVIEQSFINALKSSLPELPSQKRARYQTEMGLNEYDADVLTQSIQISTFFDQTLDQLSEQLTLKSADPLYKTTANWITSELSGLLKSLSKTFEENPITSTQMAQLMLKIHDGTLSSKMAKQVLDVLITSNDSVDAIIDAKGLKQVNDDQALEAMILEVMNENPKQVEQYRSSPEDKRKKMTGFFVGQIMKKSNGQANPKIINELLAKLLNQ